MEPGTSDPREVNLTHCPPVDRQDQASLVLCQACKRVKTFAIVQRERKKREARSVLTLLPVLDMVKARCDPLAEEEI